MGGLRPFGGSYFAEDGLDGFGGKGELSHFPKTATPTLAQFLVFEVYDDRVVFFIRNTGTCEGYAQTDKPESYTVYL